MRTEVALLTGEATAERDRRRLAFNAPFRPYVVIATEVSQEGVDLQRECSTIIHHDLTWNPATLEQRVGRVDRIRSKAERELLEGRDSYIYVGIPYIRGTIDERMWQVVSQRRKWLDICLGLEHDWDTGTLDDEAIPLPDSAAQRLRIDLSLSGRR